MKFFKYFLILACLYINTFKAQQGCDLNAIRTALTGAGCTELTSCQSSCSMYFYNPQGLTGIAAQQFAENLGANLISVQSSSENSCISSALVSNGFGGIIWLGLSDANSEGTFYWYDEEPVVYTNWNAGEPNDAGGEDCIQIYPDGLWNDVPCAASAQSIIEVSLCPQITASNDVTICNNSSANLTCSEALYGSKPYVYTWSNGQTGQSISVSPSVTTTYTVTATDRYGCFVTEDVVVSVLGTVPAAFTTTNLCLGEMSQFSDNTNITAPDALSNSSWDFGDGSQSVGTIVSHQFLTAGNYVVTHSVTTSNGCSGSTTENVTINEIPIINFTLNDGCSNTAINFVDASISNSGNISTWNWDFGDNIGVGTNASESYSYTSAGSFNVNLIVSDNQGCSNTLTQPIEIFEGPLVSFNYSNVCLGETANFVDASTIGGANIISSWSWDIDGDNIEDYNTQNVDHIFTAVGDYDVTLTLVSNNGCTSSNTQTISVFSVPVVGFTSSNYCMNEMAQFVDNSVIQSPGVIANSGWDFGDGVQSIGNQVSHQYLTAGNYIVTHAVSTINGCVEVAIENITINEVPSVNFTVNNACTNTAINFVDNSTPSTTITNWNWDFGDNIGVGTNATESYSYSTVGNYDITLIVSNAQGCSNTLIESVNIYEAPLPTFNFINGCLNDTVNFIDASIIGAPNNIISWSWDIDGDNTEDYTTQDLNYLYNTPGDFDVTLTVGSDNGCFSSITQTISMFPIPIVSFSASTTCVNGDETQFINNSTISSGSIVSNGWSFGDGATSTQQSPSHNYQIASSYLVTLAVVSDLGCIESETYRVEVLDTPSAGFIQDTTNGCAPLCIVFTDTSYYDTIPLTNWSWKFEDNYGESTDQHPIHCFYEAGDYDVGLIITNEQGCKDTLENIGLVSILPLPISDFTLSPTSTDVLNSTIDFTNNSTDAVAWIWSFGDGSDNDYSNYDPSYTYGDTGHFEIQLVVINSYLCNDTSYQYVEILPVDDLFVPSAFSPNGDGRNDVLYARGYIGTIYFAVYDRLGKKVFESKDKESGWDGLINGKKALEGVYTWYLQAEVNGKDYKLKGDVTLVR